jgi:O-antigen/teichoic acid export membrane protein
MAQRDQTQGRSFANEAVRGSAWTAAQVAISKVAAAGATFFLGFLLQPSDFGLAWFAISAGGLATGLHVLAALDVLLASPRGLARIAGPIQALAAGTAVAELAVVATLGFVLSAMYPDRHGLLALMVVVSIRPLTDALNVLPMAKMRLSLEYRRLAAIDGLTTLLGSIGAIAMAYTGCGAMSIAVPPIVATGIRGILYWSHTGAFIGKWTAGTRFRALRRRFVLATFGSYLSGILLILDTTILGLFVAPASLGMFAFASGLATQINGIVSYQIAGALHPIFAHLRNEQERQVQGLLRACRLIACVLVPILLVQAAVAGPVFRMVWGEKWDAAVPIFMAISVGQAFMICQWPASFTLKAQGRFKGFLKLQVLQVLVSASTCCLAASIGGPIIEVAAGRVGIHVEQEVAAPMAVAVNGALMTALFGPLTLWLAGKLVGVGPRSVVALMTTPWVAALPAAIGAGWVIRQIEATDVSRGGRIALTIPVIGMGVLAGILGSTALSRSSRQDLGHLIRRLRPGKRRTDE